MLHRFPRAWRMVPSLVLVLLVPMGALAGIGYYLNSSQQENAGRQVGAVLDLASHMEHSLIQEGAASMRDAAVAAATDPTVVQALTDPQTSVAPNVKRYAGAFPRADMVVLVNRNGVAVGRSTSDVAGGRVTLDGLVDKVLTEGRPQAYPAMIGAADLQYEGASVHELVGMPILATKGSSDPRFGGRVDSALALVGVAPVTAPSGAVVGAVIAADILNSDFRIVDEVARWSENGIPVMATIAMDGVRVTTTVRLVDPDGNRTEHRALGTVYSDKVMAVLRQNQTYRGPAEVVGQWQRTIYRPVTDWQERVIGGAYVGIPESYFAALGQKSTRTGQIGLVIGLAALLAAVAGALFLVHRMVVMPLRGMAAKVDQSAADLVLCSESLGASAERSDEEARRVLVAGEGSLTAAADLRRGAADMLARLRQLEEAVGAVGAGARREERSVLYIGRVTEEIASGLSESQAQAGDVVADVARLTATARSALRQVGDYAAGLALLRQELSGKESHALELLKDPSDLLCTMAAQAERVAEEVRTLLLVLQENQARLAFIHEEMGRVSTVVQNSAGRTEQAGKTAGAVIAWLESVTGTAAAMADEVLAARGALEGVAAANEQLHDMCRTMQHQVEWVREAVAQLRQA